ncbi:hypothetical protein K501DRAFT_284332 [Backusella circina FSU 941]|nr:hypothetical protein K501DRAFT_284332 [Backusella circina FSU 941]
MNYYETRINQHAALNHSADNISYHDDETLSILQSLHDEIEALGCQSLKLSSSEDETNEEENDDDDNDDDSCTETTASSIYDIRSNLYQYYRDRVRHTPEIDENTDLTEEPISTMSGPYASSITTESAGYISPDDVSIITTDVGSNDTVQEIHRKQSNYPKQYFPTQRKKKIFARMIERMRLAAEKPFWSIESHF